jgi:CRP-like cAMP-binding protein
MLEPANTTIENVYFPLSGIVSVVAKSGAEQIEAGVIGREGMTGAAVVMGNHRSPNEVYVQVAGSGLRIEADKLRAALDASESLRLLAQKFVQVFFAQVTQTALANGRAKLDERLARWLLMAHDRHDDDHLLLTHEFVALMLGVRRPGVTDALHELEGRGLLRATRGVIRILNRKGLEELAGSAYGVPEAEYKRLIGEAVA